MKKIVLIIAYSICLVGFSQETISIMSYNILNFPGNTWERVNGLEKIIKYKTPDIFVVNELISEVGANLILDSALNIGGVTHYSKASFVNGYDSDNLLFYNHNKLSLHSQTQIPTDLRDISHYVLYFDNLINNDTVWFNVFSCHLKSSSGDLNEFKRYEEVQQLKNYLSAYNIEDNLFVAGDFNFYSNFEEAYYEITTGGTSNLFDPINKEALWHNNYNFKGIHTQSTRGATIGLGGGSLGGLDDRFDFIFISEDLFSGENYVRVKDNSYIAVGQDGEHFDNAVNFSVNNSAPDSIIQALYTMSDHLPVYMELEIGNFSAISSNENEKVYTFSFSNEKVIIKTNQPFYMSVYTSDGRLVMDRENNEIIKVSELNNGLYFCKIQIQGRYYIEKIIISK